MIKFRECIRKGYAARTYENAARADVTIAVATDFSTAGEKCTLKAVLKAKKCYIAIDLNNTILAVQRLNGIVDKINKEVSKKEIVINLAGNGIYSLDWEEENLCTWLIGLLKGILEHPQFDYKVLKFISGGQSGIDTQGILAADHLNYECDVLAPKGWFFRNKYGNDYSNEQLFKQRFNK